MNFTQAKNFVMPFGKYKGLKLDDIAADGEGLLYIDWLSGEMHKDTGPVATALRAYLADNSIQADLRDAMDDSDIDANWGDR